MVPIIGTTLSMEIIIATTSTTVTPSFQNHVFNLSPPATPRRERSEHLTSHYAVNPEAAVFGDVCFSKYHYTVIICTTVQFEPLLTITLSSW
jgi:hypothetical protein